MAYDKVYDKPTIIALSKLSKLISRLNTDSKQEVIDEIKAYNRLLERYIGQLKRTDDKWEAQTYDYDRKTKKIVKRNVSGREITRY
jgi:hypothetical protein